MGEAIVHRVQSSLKKQLRQALRRRDFHEPAELAGRKRRVLGLLVALTFDPEPLIGWRAVEAMGAAAGRIAEDDPDCVRQHLRRLHWLLSEESGGVCWRAPEAMAEIVRRTHPTFADYVPIIVSLIEQMAEEDLAHFRPGVLWAIGRLGPVADEELDAAAATIVACLGHHDPQVRGMAAWCLGQCGRSELLAQRDALLADRRAVELYLDGDLCRVTVSELARQAGASHRPPRRQAQTAYNGHTADSCTCVKRTPP